MVYAETPITTAIREGVELAWALDLSGSGERLVAGEESASCAREHRDARAHPLLRVRIRMEIDHAEGDERRRTEPLDPDDAQYEAELLRAFRP